MTKWNLFIDVLHCDIILMKVKHIFPLYSHYHNAYIYEKVFLFIYLMLM